MEKKYLPFNSKSENEQWCNTIDLNMGFPDGKGTNSYTSILEHLTDNRAMCLICSDCYHLITQEQINSLITVEQAVIDGWLPESIL